MLIHKDEKIGFICRINRCNGHNDVNERQLQHLYSYSLLYLCCVSLISSLNVETYEGIIVKYKNSQTRVGIIYKMDNLETHSP